MAHTLTDLRAFRDRLFESRVSGIREVEDQNGERVFYRGDAEMKAALAALDREIRVLEAGQPPTTIRFRTSKGL